MPKPSTDDTTQPEPNLFDADRVLGRCLFDLAEARDALAAAQRAGVPALIEGAARTLVDSWRSAREARACLDRQLATLAQRGRTVAFAMRMNARIVGETARRALHAVPAGAPIGEALAVICREADAFGAEPGATAPVAREPSDAI
jgi:hypothetical protein